MTGFVNASAFDDASRNEAAKGIVDPQRREIAPGTILYRFGNSEGMALRGRWWIDEDQFAVTKQWALEHLLAVPLAVRVHCAIAHDYGSMRAMVRVRVAAPLLAWEGASAPQTVRSGSRVNELLAPTMAAFRQMFIPGLADPRINGAALARLSVMHFASGASHIGGVPLFPKGAIVQ